MSDPTSNIGKWVSFGWDEKTAGMIDIANAIAEAGKTNSDYAVFVPEWFPFYGATARILAGKTVDPDDVEPFVNAWIKYSYANQVPFSATSAKQSMVDSGLDGNKAYVVANTMYRLNLAGKLPLIISNPSGWANNTGLGLTDIGHAIEQIGSSALTIAKMWPWILLGVGAFVAWPYIKAARAPAQMLGGRR